LAHGVSIQLDEQTGYIAVRGERLGIAVPLRDTVRRQAEVLNRLRM